MIMCDSAPDASRGLQPARSLERLRSPAHALRGAYSPTAVQDHIRINPDGEGRSTIRLRRINDLPYGATIVRAFSLSFPAHSCCFFRGFQRATRETRCRAARASVPVLTRPARA